MDIRQRIEDDIGEKLSFTEDSSFTMLPGGVVTGESGRKFYLKRGIPSPAYQCEANGLRELARPRTIRVAEVFSVGDDYILTGYVRNTHVGHDFFERFGRNLARMHRYTAPDFGFYEDNFIGLNPQQNIPHDGEAHDWAEFWLNKRLLPQFRMAGEHGYVNRSMAADFAKLEKNLRNILYGSTESPALLHGDLWSGNFISGPDGEPILIDPAVYYGHREAELAMTMLFGGFPPEFYDAYNAEYPLPDGWRRRTGIYKLYHILNHLNIFGRSYLAEAEQILRHVV